MKTKHLLLLAALSLSSGMAFAQGPNETGTYYKNANGQTGQNLRTALSKIIGGPKVTSYDGLISAYEKTDTRPDGTVRDWYSIDTKYKHGKDTGTYHEEGDSYNREHSVPQSWFNKKSPMKSDIVHVVPTDGYVNNRRSSFPFGMVNKVTYSSGLKDENKGYCKLGTSASAGYSGTVFEVPDEIKGDMARIYFYMATCYKDQCAGWGGNIFNSNGLVQWELDQMLAWSRQDRVDQRETERNNAVQGVQGNRNPFVDYPGLEEYIWGTKVGETFSYDNYEGHQGDTDVPTIAMPVFETAPGNYYNEVTITLSCATEGAKIYYTTSGAQASANSIEYTGPFTITESTTINAVAVLNNKYSYHASAFYYIVSDEEEQPGEQPQPEDPTQEGEEPTDGEIAFSADFFGTSYTGALPSSATDDLEGKEGGVSVVYSLATGSNRYANGEQIRLYPGNKLVFSVAEGTITGLEFTFVDGTPNKNLKVDATTFSDGKWTGSAQNVTVVFAGTSKHARLKSVKISVSGGATAIDAVPASLSGQRVVYNLRGQRVARPSHGMYIVDGKKVMIP